MTPFARGLWALALASVALLAGALAPASAPAQPDRVPAVDAEAWLLVAAESGTVIAGRNARERHPIASATKLMTALLALERSRPGQVMTAADYQAAPIESQIGLRPGERMAVRDLLVALLLESANDAAMTLAEGIAGTPADFVAAMNERADELGLTGTSYANPIGFDDPDNHSTASDLATLSRALMEKPRFRRIVAEPELDLASGARPRTVANRNDLVGVAPEVDGIKTGQTQRAGHVLVGSAERDGNRVISVVLGAPSEAARDSGSLALLRHGLDQFVERSPIRAGEAVGRAEVADSDERVALEAARAVTVTTLRGEPLTVELDAPDELDGPLPADERVGHANVVRGDERVARVALVTAREVPGPGLATRFATTLGDHWAVAATLALLLTSCGTLLALRMRGPRRTRTSSRA